MTDNDKILLELGTIKGQLGGVLTALASHSARMNNHSSRIGAVERRQSWVLGAATATSSLLVAVLSYVGLRD